MPFRIFYSLGRTSTRFVLNLSDINKCSGIVSKTILPRSSNTCSYISSKCTFSTAYSNLPVPSTNEFDSSTVLKEENEQNLLEDVSDYAPATTPTFNFASFINNSPTLQEFVKLGVNLYKLEHKKEVVEFLLKLDFESNVKKYLTFLHDMGVPAHYFGQFITRYPLIFKEDIDNLQIRINYLHSKRFTTEMITEIITKDPNWLSFNTKEIDTRLGKFQMLFKLKGNEVRLLAVNHPKLITYDMSKIQINVFGFKEEMGFSLEEMKKILLTKPKLFRNGKKELVERFSYIHNVMHISHDLIANQPSVLASRLFRTKQRHLFLKSLGRAQYDPNEPGYISLTDLVSGTDSDFCKNVAKTSVTTFNLFQKTL